MATKKKVVEQPKSDVKEQVKEFLEKRETCCPHERKDIDLQILELTKDN